MKERGKSGEREKEKWGESWIGRSTRKENRSM